MTISIDPTLATPTTGAAITDGGRPQITPLPAPAPAQPEEASQAEKAAQWLDEALAVNVGEVTAEPVTVALVEYKQKTVTDEDGTERTVNRRITTSHEIDTFVPMRIFNRMIAERETAIGKGPDALLQWQVNCVLAVWQLTEPDMTRDRLIDGLGFKAIGGLFARFFKDELNQKSGGR